jgi:hypothetical protein
LKLGIFTNFLILYFNFSDKKWNFLDNPIEIIVTTLSSPAGAGKLSTFDAKNYFGTKESQRIRILNADKLCLFYAVEVARTWHDKALIAEMAKEGKEVPKELIKQQAFYRIQKIAIKQRELAIKLLNEVKISNDLDQYGIEHLQQIQEFYDLKYPDLYRIVVMDDSPETKPIWKGPMGRKFIVALYLENGHYDALKSISAYYGHRKYCPGIIC